MLKFFPIVFILTLTISFKLTGQEFNSDSCGEIIKPSKIFGIKGTKHCLALVTAKYIIIRTDQIDPNKLKSVTVCSGAYYMFGNIGVNVLL